MQDATYRRLPLRNRSGEVIAYTLVDATDYERVARHRWHLSPYGYATRTMPRSVGHGTVWLHREIVGLPSTIREPASWFWSNCAAEERPRVAIEVDHINGNGLDNRRANLRHATRSQNSQNRPVPPGTSRHRGVSWFAPAKLWQASFSVDGQRRHLGYFRTEAEAASTAAAFMREIGHFAER